METSVAESADKVPRTLPEAVIKPEVRDLEDIRAGALEVSSPTLVGEVLQRLDRNKLWDYAKRDINKPLDPEWLDKATTTIEEARQQNKARQLEAEEDLKASTPTFLNVSIWPEDLRRAVENGELNPFATATPAVPEIFENQVAVYLELRKALERNSDFLPKKFMSKFPNILQSVPKGTGSAASGADVPADQARLVTILKDPKKQKTEWVLRESSSASSDSGPKAKARSSPLPPEGTHDLGLTYEFTLSTGSSHVQGKECPEDKKLMVLKWMLKQQVGVVKLATGTWKVRTGQFKPPEWVVKASTQLPEALKAELEANTNPSTFFVREAGVRGQWKDFEIEEQVKLKTRPDPKKVLAGVMAPYDDSDNTVHWCKDIQTWNLPTLMQSMGDKFTCSHIWDYWCSLPSLTEPRKRGARNEGSKRAASNIQRLDRYKIAKEEATSLLKDMGLETAAVGVDTWRSILKRIGTMLAASVFITENPQPLMELPVVEGHDSKQAMWERVMCDERITIPREYLMKIPSLAADMSFMEKMVEVKVYYRCNTTVWWIQKVRDSKLRGLFLDKLTSATSAAGGADEATESNRDSIVRDVHMSAAPMETGDETMVTRQLKMGKRL